MRAGPYLSCQAVSCSCGHILLVLHCLCQHCIVEARKTLSDVAPGGMRPDHDIACLAVEPFRPTILQTDIPYTFTELDSCGTTKLLRDMLSET
jgi:hypothetical protein